MKAGTGAKQARLGKVVRERQTVRLFLGRAEQAEDHRLQVLLRSCPHRGRERTVENPADGAQAGDQHQDGDQGEPNVEPHAAAGPKPFRR